MGAFSLIVVINLLNRFLFVCDPQTSLSIYRILKASFEK